MRWENRPRRIGLSWKLRNVCLQRQGVLEHSLGPRRNQDAGVWDAQFTIFFIAGGELDSGGSSAEWVPTRLEHVHDDQDDNYCPKGRRRYLTAYKEHNI